ncbi:MAG TPA: hypothetical protein VMM36_11090 [Opitutaceae bacterium]|nr:hypothetical protein [Opitutaceae bacterium]
MATTTTRRRPRAKASKRGALKPRAGSLYKRIKHLVGVISGPGDLSTNPKYMEGYGESRRP